MDILFEKAKSIDFSKIFCVGVIIVIPISNKDFNASLTSFSSKFGLYLKAFEISYKITPTQEILEKSIDLAFSNNISIYDSIYISLAEIIGFNLITADEKLYNKVNKIFDFVNLL